MKDIDLSQIYEIIEFLVLKVNKNTFSYFYIVCICSSGGVCMNANLFIRSLFLFLVHIFIIWYCRYENDVVDDRVDYLHTAGAAFCM